MTPYDVIRPQQLETFSGGAAEKQKVVPKHKFVVFMIVIVYLIKKKHWGPNKNSIQFADNIFTCISFEDNFVIFIQIPLMFAAECAIDDMLILDPVMIRWYY